MTLHVHWGPNRTLATCPDDRPWRWCFSCREHLPHSWALIGDVEPSYYEDVPVLRCSRCGHDCADFPGIYRDGPRYPSQEVWEYLVAGAHQTRELERSA